MAEMFFQYSGICIANQEMRSTSEKGNAIEIDGI
jgi:hypothetical protein